jgi:hypothetical protein
MQCPDRQDDVLDAVKHDLHTENFRGQWYSTVTGSEDLAR